MARYFDECQKSRSSIASFILFISTVTNVLLELPPFSQLAMFLPTWRNDVDPFWCCLMLIHLHQYLLSCSNNHIFRINVIFLICLLSNIWWSVENLAFYTNRIQWVLVLIIFDSLFLLWKIYLYNEDQYIYIIFFTLYKLNSYFTSRLFYKYFWYIKN